MMDMLDKSYGAKKRTALQISLLIHLYLLWGQPWHRNFWAPNWEIGFCRHRYLDHQGISCWRPMWYPPAVYIIPWIVLRLLLIFMRSRHKPAVSTAMLIKGLPWRVLTVCTINFIFSIAFFPLHPHVHMTLLRSLQNDFFQFIQDLRCPEDNVAEATGERRTTTTAGIRKFGWISEQRLFVHVASDLTNYIIPCLFGNGMCKASVITWILLPVLFKAADKHPKLCFLNASLRKRLLVLPKRLQVDLAFWNSSAHGNFSPPLCWIFPIPALLSLVPLVQWWGSVWCKNGRIWKTFVGPHSLPHSSLLDVKCFKTSVDRKSARLCPALTVIKASRWFLFFKLPTKFASTHTLTQT